MYNIEMDEQERNDIAEAYQSEGIYCLGCEECRKQCPEQLPIPDLMRAYMYAVGYSDSLEAQRVIKGLSLNTKPCINCDNCVVKCTKGFDIADKICQVMRLKDIPAEFLC